MVVYLSCFKKPVLEMLNVNDTNLASPSLHAYSIYVFSANKLCYNKKLIQTYMVVYLSCFKKPVLEMLNVNDTNLASPSLQQHACAHICIWNNFNQLRPPHPPLHKGQIFFLCLLRTLIVGTRQNRLVKEYTQQAHAVIATSDQRTCNVITFMQRHIYVVARTLI